MPDDPPEDQSPAEVPSPFGTFVCEMCRGTFAMGDDDDARAEAEARGIDHAAAGLVCDDCYARTPYGASPGLN